MQKLIEDSRAKLLNKAKKGANYKGDKSKGKNRYQRRTHSSVSNNVKNYNKLDMNNLFKNNILDVVIDVKGETDNYQVKIKFANFLDELHSELKRNQIFNFRTVARALIRSFNGENVYIHCSCPDWRYRMDYFAHVNDIASTEKPDDPLDRPSKITNPNDTLGPGCKHTLLVISNNSWLNKVASVIFNYVNYMEKHQHRLYADVIYPAIYEKPYEDDVQLDIFSQDNDELASDENALDISNEYARTKNQFKLGNQSGVQFAPKNDNKQLDIDSIEV